MTKEERNDAIEFFKKVAEKEVDGARYSRLAIEALEQESCDDAISRKVVLDIVDGYSESQSNVEDVTQDIISDILTLLSVKPQEPKIGRWIQTNEFFINQDGQFIYKFICSECKSLFYFRKSNKKAIGANVCPNCGAKMQKVEE